jgi:hypothetical protein
LLYIFRLWLTKQLIVSYTKIIIELVCRKREDSKYVVFSVLLWVYQWKLGFVGNFYGQKHFEALPGNLTSSVRFLSFLILLHHLHFHPPYLVHVCVCIPLQEHYECEPNSLKFLTFQESKLQYISDGPENIREESSLHFLELTYTCTTTSLQLFCAFCFYCLKFTYMSVRMDINHWCRTF